MNSEIKVAMRLRMLTPEMESYLFTVGETYTVSTPVELNRYCTVIDKDGFDLMVCPRRIIDMCFENISDDNTRCKKVRNTNMENEKLKVILNRVADQIEEIAQVLMNAEISESVSHSMNAVSHDTDILKNEIDEL